MHDAKRVAQIFCAQYSDDGSMFAAASQEGMVRIWDTGTWKCTRSGPLVVAAARSSRGQGCARPLSGLEHPGLRVLARLQVAGVHQLELLAAAGQRAGSCCGCRRGGSLSALQGEVETHESILVDEGDEGRFGIFSVHFDCNSTQAVCGATDCSAHLVDLVASRTTQHFVGHDDDVNTVAFSKHDPNIFFTGSDDCRLAMYDRRAGDRPTGWFEGHTEGITCVDASPSNAHYVRIRWQLPPLTRMLAGGVQQQGSERATVGHAAGHAALQLAQAQPLGLPQRLAGQLQPGSLLFVAGLEHADQRRGGRACIPTTCP